MPNNAFVLLHPFRRLLGRPTVRRPGALILVLLLGLLTTPAVAASHSGSRSWLPGPEHAYSVWRGGYASLPDHTVYRPKNLNNVPALMPIVLWANGGCRDSNMEFHYFLTTFASYGTFIVANGEATNPYVVTELTPLLSPEPKKLVDGLNWALAQNKLRSSPLYGRLDPSKVLVMGQSCGGWEAVDASSDPRVTATIIWNSGANPYHPAGLTALHAPIMFVEGGTFDHVAWDAIASYHAVTVPTVHVTGTDGGHTNWWDDPSSGPVPDATQKEPLPIATNWLLYTLYGSSAGRRFFLGSPCGLCAQPTWTVESRNW